MSGLTTNYDLIEAAMKYQIPLLTVANKDHIPKHQLATGGFIFNLEDSVGKDGGTLPGTHWVAMYVDLAKKKAIYFDPFGFPPPVSVIEAFKRFLPIEHSSIQVQSARSTVCGYYCLFFVWFISQDPSPSLNTRLSNFLKLFNAVDPSKNLELLKRYFRLSF